MTAPLIPGEPDPLQAYIGKSRDLVIAERWAPPKTGIAPEIRLGKHWFNVLWIIPITVVLLIFAIAVARELRTIPLIEEFIKQYPGTSATSVSYSGFPLWVRLQHALNLFLMMFIIRSGIQILADHPRLYWNNNCTPGTEWFRFQKEVPKGVPWTAKDDAVTLPGWLGIPGIRHSIGLARWWHFSCDLFWLVNGLVFYIFLFGTSQWQRLIPTSWDVFPNALSTLLQYLSLQMPIENGWIRYNALQQLAYFLTVFIAAPLAVFTGLMQAPAISNTFGWVGKAFNRQVARSIHFLVLFWFIQFIGIHIAMVLITGMRRNLNHITLGNDSFGWTGTIIATIVLTLILVIWFWASPFTLNHARIVQRIGYFLVGWIKAMLELWDPKTQYTEKDIAPFLWPNGLLPTSKEFEALTKNGYADYKLRVDGLVKEPQAFTLAELKVMPKQEQITNHFCIQGWSGIAKWGGVPMKHIIDLVQPLPQVQYVVFYSFGEGSDGGTYYDTHLLSNMKHQLTILAYEMNGQPLPLLHGAPLRLRCENELGFKQVKWIQAIEFVDDFSQIGSGQGGYNEDHEFFGYRMPI